MFFIKHLAFYNPGSNLRVRSFTKSCALMKVRCLHFDNLINLKVSFLQKYERYLFVWILLLKFVWSKISWRVINYGYISKNSNSHHKIAPPHPLLTHPPPLLVCCTVNYNEGNHTNFQNSWFFPEFVQFHWATIVNLFDIIYPLKIINSWLHNTKTDLTDNLSKYC